VDHRIEAVAALLDHGLGDHQFADQVDQLVDLLDRDADRARFGLRVAASAAFLAAFFRPPLRSLRALPDGSPRPRPPARAFGHDAGFAADLFDRLEEAVAALVVGLLRLRAFTSRLVRIEEAVALLVLDAGAFGGLDGALLGRQRRRFEDLQVVRDPARTSRSRRCRPGPRGS
jgi:hypothetical protein